MQEVVGSTPIFSTIAGSLETVEGGEGKPNTRNGKLSGSVHPETGVPFVKGFPDFSNYLYKGGANNVIIKPTGSRVGDAAAANKIAGYANTPEGHVWHHHQITGRMQLVNEKIHAQTGHTGGFSIWGK